MVSGMLWSARKWLTCSAWYAVVRKGWYLVVSKGGGWREVFGMLWRVRYGRCVIQVTNYYNSVLHYAVMGNKYPLDVNDMVCNKT